MSFLTANKPGRRTTRKRRTNSGVFFIGGALRLPVTAVFVLTMTGAAVAGIFGAAAAAPLARLTIDARDIIAAHRKPGGGSAA